MKSQDELEKEIETIIQSMLADVEYGECFIDKDERDRLLRKSTKLHCLIQNLYNYF